MSTPTSQKAGDPNQKKKLWQRLKEIINNIRAFFNPLSVRIEELEDAVAYFAQTNEVNQETLDHLEKVVSKLEEADMDDLDSVNKAIEEISSILKSKEITNSFEAQVAEMGIDYDKRDKVAVYRTKDRVFAEVDGQAYEFTVNAKTSTVKAVTVEADTFADIKQRDDFVVIASDYNDSTRQEFVNVDLRGDLWNAIKDTTNIAIVNLQQKKDDIERARQSRIEEFRSCDHSTVGGYTYRISDKDSLYVVDKNGNSYKFEVSDDKKRAVVTCIDRHDVRNGQNKVNVIGEFTADGQANFSAINAEEKKLLEQKPIGAFLDMHFGLKVPEGGIKVVHDSSSLENENAYKKVLDYQARLQESLDKTGKEYEIKINRGESGKHTAGLCIRVKGGDSILVPLDSSGNPTSVIVNNSASRYVVVKDYSVNNSTLNARAVDDEMLKMVIPVVETSNKIKTEKYKVVAALDTLQKEPTVPENNRDNRDNRQRPENIKD
jgi:hypothetical protein